MSTHNDSTHYHWFMTTHPNDTPFDDNTPHSHTDVNTQLLYTQSNTDSWQNPPTMTPHNDNTPQRHTIWWQHTPLTHQWQHTMTTQNGAIPCKSSEYRIYDCQWAWGARHTPALQPHRPPDEMLLTYICDMTLSHVWHDLFTGATWHIHTCDMTFSFVWDEHERQNIRLQYTT